jgi:CBS domain-containing protein
MVDSATTAYEAAERMVRERRLALAITDNGVPHAMVTLQAVRGVPPERRAQIQVRDIASPIEVLSPDDEATRALRAMTENDVPLLPVAEHGQLSGAVSRHDILRTMQLSELEATQRALRN